MWYIVKKIIEYRKYKEDIKDLFELMLAIKDGKDISLYKVELNTNKGNFIAKNLIKLFKDNNG